MYHDFIWWNILKQRYPGSIHMLRYEDLASAPVKKTQEVYKFINRTLPEPVEHFLHHTMQGGKEGQRKDSNPFSTSRANSTATAHKWRKGWTKLEIDKLSKVCYDVIKAYGYDLK